MAYVTIDDVRARFPQVQFSANTKPSEEQVGVWISEVEAQLNASLSNLGYIVPITEAVDILQIKDRLVSKVGGRALRARLFGVGDVSQDGSREAEAEYDKWLAALMNPRSPVELTASSRTSAEVLKAGGVVRGFVPDSDVAGGQARALIGKVF